MRDLQAELDKEFPGQVEVRFLDVMLDGAIENYPDIIQFLFERQPPLPLVTIDRVPKLAGGLPVAAIIEELEAAGAKSEATDGSDTTGRE